MIIEFTYYSLKFTEQVSILRYYSTKNERLSLYLVLSISTIY